jgi:serpin B
MAVGVRIAVPWLGSTPLSSSAATLPKPSSLPARLLPTALGAVLCVLVQACGLSDPSTAPPLLTGLPRALTTGETAAVEANNGFAWRLLTTVSQAEPGANQFVSPLSVSLALGMVALGARGTTATEMATGLGFAGLSPAEIGASEKTLVALIQGLDPLTDFTIANSLWIERTFTVRPEFLAAAKDDYDADATTLDFSSPTAVTTINDWVNRKTHGKIPTILDAIAPEEVLFAINATYFKAPWRTAFDPAQTRDQSFTEQNGQTQSVPFIHREISAPYFADATVQAMDLWYGNGAYTMTVLLPRPGTDVDALVASLNPTRWATIIGGLNPQELVFAMPKLVLEYKRHLNDDLAALGILHALDPQGADLSGIAGNPGDLYITRVDHKTYVSIDEQGTEAAAVTDVGVGVTSAPSGMIVDHPFVFVIRERWSGTILFLGRIASIPQH